VVLRRFAGHLRLNQLLKKKAISASVYPLVLLVMMLVLVSILLVFVIPQFQSFYQGLNVELPTPTRVLLALSGSLRANLVWILLGLASAAGAFIYWYRREGSGVAMDRALLRALREGTIGGAILDTFREEPLQPDSAFYGLPNVIVTPSTSWSSGRVMTATVELFAENLRRYVAGAPLLNTVDPGAGY